MHSPVIGITCDFDWQSRKTLLYEGYYNSVSRAGGLPFLLPSGIQNILQILDLLDGIILSGGGDVSPLIYGEQPHPRLGDVDPVRDNFELELCRQAFALNIPVLGICRGMQIMNVAAGGTLYQDIKSQYICNESILHSQKGPKWYAGHAVALKDGCRLKDILGVDSFNVNSFHHQAVKDVATMFTPVCMSPDGIIEAIEANGVDFAIGVQWHPEVMLEADDLMLGLFKALTKSDSQFAVL